MPGTFRAAACGTKRHSTSTLTSRSRFTQKRLMFTRPLGQRLTAAAIGLNGTLEHAHHRRGVVQAFAVGMFRILKSRPGCCRRSRPLNPWRTVRSPPSIGVEA